MDKKLHAGDLWTINNQTLQIIGEMPNPVQTPAGLLDWVAQDLQSQAIMPISGQNLVINGVRRIPYFNSLDLSHDDWTIYTSQSGETVIAVGDTTLQGVTNHSIIQGEWGPAKITMEVQVLGAIITKTEKTELTQESENEEVSNDFSPTSDTDNDEQLREQGALAHESQ